MRLLTLAITLMFRNLFKGVVTTLVIAATAFSIGLILPLTTNADQKDLLEKGLEELMNEPVVFVDVLSNHIHLDGEWMTGYKYMNMVMGGNRSGTTDNTEQDVLNQFMITPIDMTMQMHMLEIMYGVTNEFTAMFMIPYHIKTMDHINRAGVTFRTRSEGIGDVKLMAHYAFYRKNEHTIMTVPGISFPTGSIDQRADLPTGDDSRLPYPMQSGSGTFDFHPGLVYYAQRGDWGWGAKLNGIVRSGRNKNHYRLGDEFRATGWISRKVVEWLNATARLETHMWGNVEGADPALSPGAVPTADPNRRGGERINFFFGLKSFFPGKNSSGNEGNRVSIEFGLPVYESLNGPQLGVDWESSFVWNWTF